MCVHPPHTPDRQSDFSLGSGGCRVFVLVQCQLVSILHTQILHTQQGRWKNWLVICCFKSCMCCMWFWLPVQVCIKARGQHLVTSFITPWLDRVSYWAQSSSLAKAGWSASSGDLPVSVPCHPALELQTCTVLSFYRGPGPHGCRVGTLLAKPFPSNPPPLLFRGRVSLGWPWTSCITKGTLGFLILCLHLPRLES